MHTTLALRTANPMHDNERRCRAAYVPYLVKYGRDLTAEAKHGRLEPIIGRDDVLQRMSHILLRRTKNNPVLLGEPGVGKTAVVEALANAIAANAVRLNRHPPPTVCSAACKTAIYSAVCPKSLKLLRSCLDDNDIYA